MKKLRFISLLILIGLVTTNCSKITKNNTISTLKNKVYMNGITYEQLFTKIAGVTGDINYRSFRTEEYAANPNIYCVEVNINSDSETYKVWRFQFLVNTSTNYLELSYIEINGEPENRITLSVILHFYVTEF